MKFYDQSWYKPLGITVKDYLPWASLMSRILTVGSSYSIRPSFGGWSWRDGFGVSTVVKAHIKKVLVGVIELSARSTFIHIHKLRNMTAPGRFRFCSYAELRAACPNIFWQLSYLLFVVFYKAIARGAFLAQLPFSIPKHALTALPPRFLAKTFVFTAILSFYGRWG